MSMFVVSSPCFGEANRRAKLGGFLDSSKSFFKKFLSAARPFPKASAKVGGFSFVSRGRVVKES